ncbi:MAG TPA: lysine--tRNA ligase [Verrucomicrobiae bacterium]|jgi:lysyl-tRNA synthetase class 2
MEETNSLIEQRRAKLKALRDKGIDPFKNKFTPTEKCDDAREKYKRGEYKDGQEVSVAGRITAHREMGKSQFIDVRDQSGRLQIYAQKNHLEETAPGSWDIFTHLDLGDFIGAKGTLFTTKTGEISIKLDSFVILAKALRPPPEKWHGLADTEIRYRQRYLDLMGNPEVKSVFLKRSEIIREIRNFLHERGYVEVETPMMQAIPGGAAAQPFKTRHNALGCDFYLRIALELYLKRLLVGGVDKVFEIGRNFRNEGLSRKHNPEFTMLEAYQAYGDYESMMELVQGMICHVAQKTFGSLKIIHERIDEMRFQSTFALGELCSVPEKLEVAGFEKVIEKGCAFAKESEEEVKKCLNLIGSEHSYILATRVKSTLENLKNRLTEVFEAQGEEFVKKHRPYFVQIILDRFRTPLEKLENLSVPKIIDLTPNWKRAKYKDLVREKAGADWFDVSPEVRRQRAHDMGAEITKDYEDFEVTGAVFEKLIEPTLIQPTFVTHLPKELVPLAKLSPDDPTTVEVFECCINGQEISPGYTEQNDPIEQRERLEHQAGGEQQKLDEDFLAALEHGMPPAGGIGIGIDRLCMMLLGQENIRDVILFPQLKPK